MIDVIDPTLAMQNGAGSAVLDALVLSMTADAGGATLDSALREAAAARGGDAALGQGLKEALAGTSSRGALAALDLLIDRLDIAPNGAALGERRCGCGHGEIDSGAVDDDLVTMSLFYSDGGSTGEGEQPSDDVDGDGQPDEPIPVTGEKPKTIDEDDDLGSLPTTGGGDGDNSGGDGPGGGGVIAEDTPCVNEAPAGISLSELNNLAKEAASKLGELQDSTRWEWGAFIYRGTDGRLHISELFTAKHPNSITGAATDLPAGSHIVGYVHSHPTDATSDQRNLSLEDRQFINDLISRTGDVTADPNLLVYVTTKDASGTVVYDDYKTYVYDKSERSDDDPGCTL